MWEWEGKMHKWYNSYAIYVMQIISCVLSCICLIFCRKPSGFLAYVQLSFHVTIGWRQADGSAHLCHSLPFISLAAPDYIMAQWMFVLRLWTALMTCITTYYMAHHGTKWGEIISVLLLTIQTMLYNISVIARHAGSIRSASKVQGLCKKCIFFNCQKHVYYVL